jgi:Outer membrane protein beta-barrel domain
MALVGMRRLLLLVFLFGCRPAFAAEHEIGLTLGGLFPQDRGTIPNTVRLSGGTAFQANYGRRLISGRAALYGEVHFLANPQRLVGSGNPVSTRDIATIYVTPGIRVKFAPTRSFSPYVAVGGGYAVYEQSILQIDGRPNPAPREIHRGAFDFGAGVDTSLWRWIGLRIEVRDFYTGSPAYNLPNLGGGQHNVVAGGGFVLKWGE